MPRLDLGPPRCVCRPCGPTFTILPHWSPPYGQFSFRCREQTWEATCNRGGDWEQSAPQTKGPNRSPDPATCGAGHGAPTAQPLLQSEDLRLCSRNWRFFLRAPAIPAWDWMAAGRDLHLEGKLTVMWPAVDAIKQQIPLLDCRKLGIGNRAALSRNIPDGVCVLSSEGDLGPHHS
jgi:hypothetical protein